LVEKISAVRVVETKVSTIFVYTGGALSILGLGMKERITMMKPMELGFIVALSVLTVLATGSVLRDASIGQTSYVDQAVSKGIHAVQAWARSSLWQENVPVEDLAQSKPAASTSSGPSAGLEAKGSVSGTEASGDAARWHAQDVGRLTNIVKTVLQSMTPDEWKTLGSDIAAQNPSSKAVEVASIVKKHLSPADQQWLTTHFSGPQAFNAGDLDLLQQVVSECKAKLTPDEQSQLQQELSQLLTS
jgi:hypothetical protein